MAHSRPGDEEEAITKEEMQGGEPDAQSSRNAFTELMKRKLKPAAAGPQTSRGGNPFKDRMGLGVYLADSSNSRIIHQTESAVCIHDLFPKATVHTLLLPRSREHNLVHPFDAFEDADFLAEVRREAAMLKALAARELQRVLGRESRTEARRQAVLDGEADPDQGSGGGELPPGRDWEREMVVGVHAVPSMSHLHVHVLSRDMHSPSLKHRKHYNSFTTPFLVSLDDFPLAADDPRRRTKEEAYLHWDLRCWRCGRNFGNKFKELKAHLELEFDEWKRE